MPENEPYKSKPIGQRLHELFFLIALPAFIRGFVKAAVMVGFVLGFLSKSIPINEYSISIVFLLAVFGLWKLLDHLDKIFGDFLRRTKK